MGEGLGRPILISGGVILLSAERARMMPPTTTSPTSSPIMTAIVISLRAFIDD